jgi:hypothetical protein
MFAGISFGSSHVTSCCRLSSSLSLTYGCTTVPTSQSLEEKERKKKVKQKDKES